MKWQRVIGHNMFDKANARFGELSQEAIWSNAMAMFLRHSAQGWQDAPDQYHFWFPSEDTPRHPDVLSCHCYYHGLGTAGVVEFERIHENGRWLPQEFRWRVVREEDGPALDRRGLSLEILDRLWNPAPNNAAARWRWMNWHARGEQMPIYRGMGAFYSNGDRYPFVVVETDSKLKSIGISRVDYRVVSGSEQTGDAVYEFGTEPRDNQIWEIRPSRRKADKGEHLWRFSGGYGTYVVGYMDAYRDPHK